MKIANWNINSVRIRLDHLKTLANQHAPDIICLQELKCQTEAFPYEELAELNYNLYVHGQKSGNGVAIFSKKVADEVINNFAGNPIPDQARYIEICLNTTLGYCRIICLYAPNGGEVDSDKYKIKLDFYDALINHLQKIRLLDEQIVICGDFNIAPFDLDVYKPEMLRNNTCFTAIEQKKLRTILNLGLVDNYRIVNPFKSEFSWWDYRAGAFEQNKGYRIDAIISSSGLANNLKDCFIDYETRGKPKASDHAPIIAIYEP